MDRDYSLFIFLSFFDPSVNTETIVECTLKMICSVDWGDSLVAKVLAEDLRLSSMAVHL